MNKELMEKLYEQVGEDLTSLLNYGNNSVKFVTYKRDWKIKHSEKYTEKNGDFILAVEGSIAAEGGNKWRLVCTVDEYKDFCKNKQQPIDEEIIYTIDLSHPLLPNVKVYDFFDNEITKVVKVEWTKDETYVTILSENATLRDKGNVAHFRGRVKGAKVVIQQRGEN